MIGCGRNAKNTLTVNYLYLAEKKRAAVHELHEVYELAPLPGRLRGAGARPISLPSMPRSRACARGGARTRRR
jgi:hypothetical protein